jgi:hypothetical protein
MESLLKPPVLKIPAGRRASRWLLLIKRKPAHTLELERRDLGGRLSYWIWLAISLLLVIGWLKPRIGDRWFNLIEEPAGRFAKSRRWVILCIGLGTVLARLAVLPLQPVPTPVIHDEFSNLLAADTFAHGRLTNPPHPMADFFETFHVLQHPTYASKYLPAPGLTLAMGQLVGLPWVGTLLSLAAMCMAMTWMLQGWVPPPWALLGGVLVLLRLCVFNYWFDGYLGGAIAASGAALVLGSYPRIVTSRRALDALIMGIGAVILACSRPLEGFLFCLPIAIALPIELLRTRRPAGGAALRRLSVALLGTLAAGLAFLGYYNGRVTGHPLLFPYVLYHREYFNYPIFAWQSMPAPLHYSNPQFERFFNVWHRTQYRLSWTDWGVRIVGTCWAWWYVFVGPTLTLPFLALSRVLRDVRMRLPLVQFVLCAAGLLSVVWFQPHYAAPLAATFFVLLVQSMRHLRRLECGGRPIGIYLTRLVMVLAIDWVVVLAGHAARYPTIPWSAERTRIANELQTLPGKHLVLVEYGPKHNVHQEWVYNAADIDGAKVAWARVIPGRDLSPLLDHFKDRRIWILRPDASLPNLEVYQPPRCP